MSGAADGLVALGGVLNTAVDAYRANEEARVQEVKRLHSDIDEAKEQGASLQSKLEEAVKRLDAELANVRQLQSQQFNQTQQFNLHEIAGAWFSLAAQSRVFVHRNGQCEYDTGTTMQINTVDGRLVLGGDHSLSLTKSTPKRLVWEGPATITWEQEMIGGSRQVTLELNVSKMIATREYSTAEQRIFTYPFSLIGCDVKILLCRNKKGQDGKMVAGDEFLGVHFGLRRAKTPYGTPAPPNNVDAIRCTSRIEIWDKIKGSWLHLDRTVSQRFGADGDSYGDRTAISFSRFKEIAAAGRNQHDYNATYIAKFRVTVTDIGLLELSRNSTQPLAPE